MKINFKKIPKSFYNYYLLKYYFENDYSFYNWVKENTKFKIEKCIIDLYERDIIDASNDIFYDFFQNASIDLNKFNKKVKLNTNKIFFSFEVDNIITKLRNHIDMNYFDYVNFSYALTYTAPELIDLKKYNWKNDSDYFFKHCPEYFDPDQFDWKNASLELLKYGKKFFDPKRFNWTDKEAVTHLLLHHKNLFDPNYFRWDLHSYLLIQHAPEFFDPKRFNWNDNKAVELLKTKVGEKEFKKYEKYLNKTNIST